MGILLVIFLVVLIVAASISDGVDTRPGPAGPQQRWWPGTPI
jgi:hypothetical protein